MSSLTQDERVEYTSRFISQCGYMYADESHISKTLICTICSEPWVQPVMTTHCGHVFCEQCIQTWLRHVHSCPHDRSILSSESVQDAPRILQELVDELTVICSLGCGWEGRRDGWRSHLENVCSEVEKLNCTQVVIPDVQPVDESTEEKTGDKEEETFKERWRNLAREVHTLKKQSKEHGVILERWKDKVAQLQLQLKQANELANAPPPTPSPSTEIHEATCDFCRIQIRGTRYKCLKCPDVDSCSSCYQVASDKHPVHDFVPIHSPHDIKVVALPEWKIVHPDISCNHCGRDMIGPRYKCIICADYDLCYHCIALPRVNHPVSHPMIRFINP